MERPPYEKITFFMSTAGYGVFVKHVLPMTFFVGSRSSVHKLLMAEGEGLDYFFCRPSFAWSLGVWFSCRKSDCLPLGSGRATQVSSTVRRRVDKAKSRPSVVYTKQCRSRRDQVPVWLGMILLAFVLETVDASLGMSYGTILTPVLLMMGYDPVHIVPAVIVSQLVGDFLAAFFHHQFKNVDLSIGSEDFRVGATLAGLSLVGSVCSVRAEAVQVCTQLVHRDLGRRCGDHDAGNSRENA